MALALTGWTYGNSANTLPKQINSNYFRTNVTVAGPVSRHHGQDDPWHDNSGGTNCGTGPGQRNHILFNHPNVAPFISTRLIRALVTSNPSPAYIGRIPQSSTTTDRRPWRFQGSHSGHPARPGSPKRPAGQ